MSLELTPPLFVPGDLVRQQNSHTKSLHLLSFLLLNRIYDKNPISFSVNKKYKRYAITFT